MVSIIPVYYYENSPMQYRDFFSAVKSENFIGKSSIFLIFYAQNIDCGYTLEPPLTEAVLSSTHNLCFGSKLRKIGIPLFYFINVGFKGGTYCMDLLA